MLLARAVTPEPVRPGWSQALKMSRSVLPYERLLDIDARGCEHAAGPAGDRPGHDRDRPRQGVHLGRNFRSSCRLPGHLRSSPPTGHRLEKGHIERMLGLGGTRCSPSSSPATPDSTPNAAADTSSSQPLWSVMELQDLLDEWLVAVWQNRPHDGLRDPVPPGAGVHPEREVRRAGRGRRLRAGRAAADDYVELLPATWRAINAYGIKMNRRTYDSEAAEPAAAAAVRRDRKHRDLWEIRHDPYDVSRIWVRNHRQGGWITAVLEAPAPRRRPVRRAGLGPRPPRPAGRAPKKKIADAVAALLDRAHAGPADSEAETED